MVVLWLKRLGAILGPIKVIGGGGLFLGQFSALTCMIEGSECELPLLRAPSNDDSMSFLGRKNTQLIKMEAD